MKIIYFHRNLKAGYSINKVSQTIICDIENKEEYYMPYYGAGFKALLGNILFIIKHRKPGAIHHITGDIHYGILGLLGYKSVLTVHDTVGLDFTKMSGVKNLIFKILWYKLPLLFATKVICISEVTKAYLQKYSTRKDIKVIHNAIDPRLKFTQQKSIEETAKILFIGVKENKNLLRCFDALKGIDCHVTIVGNLQEEQTKRLQKNCIKFTNKSNLTDEELNAEYANCDIVSFCSLFEGFGMPALEANQAGRPVLCSNLPVLKEVAGDAADYVDPYDVSSIRSGYLRLINEEPHRIELVEKGRINVLNFYPSVIKNRWMDVYNEIENNK